VIRVTAVGFGRRASLRIPRLENVFPGIYVQVADFDKRTTFRPIRTGALRVRAHPSSRTTHDSFRPTGRLGGIPLSVAYTRARAERPARETRIRRVSGLGCVVIGSSAGVRALMGRLIFRDRPRTGGHHRGGRYARSGLAATAKSGRSASANSNRHQRPRSDKCSATFAMGCSPSIRSPLAERSGRRAGVTAIGVLQQRKLDDRALLYS
jgi:hypothetical protein